MVAVECLEQNEAPLGQPAHGTIATGRSFIGGWKIKGQTHILCPQKMEELTTVIICEGVVKGRIFESCGPKPA
jgi:hypothetical protein